MKQHKWHKEIKAWADGVEIEARFKDEMTGWTEWGSMSSTCRFSDDDWWEYRIKPQGTKCITKDCTNHSNEGKFVNDLCGPCWDYIANGKGVHSQAYRNAQPKESRIIKEMTEAMNDLKKSLGKEHEEMLNGLTEEETNNTMSVKGLSHHKEPQYLYAYKDYVRDDGSTTSKITLSSTQLDTENYIGKIRLDTE